MARGQSKYLGHEKTIQVLSHYLGPASGQKSHHGMKLRISHLLSHICVHEYGSGDGDESRFKSAFDEVSVAPLRSRELLLRVRPGQTTRLHHIVERSRAQEKTHEGVLEKLRGICSGKGEGYKRG